MVQPAQALAGSADGGAESTQATEVDATRTETTLPAGVPPANELGELADLEDQLGELDDLTIPAEALLDELAVLDIP